MATCRHCFIRNAAQSKKGLCYRCHRDRAIRHLYVSPNYITRNNGLNLNVRPLPASFATNEQPGSAAKIRVMMERYERGEAIFHDDDYAPLRRSRRETLLEY